MTQPQQPQWIRMNREQAGRVLGQLSARDDALVFSRDATEVAWRSLAFFSNYRLCRLTNYATMPTFTMTYLTNGTEYIALDGTANPIYTADEKDPLLLTEKNVLPYVEFFFHHVQGSEGEVFLIRDPHRMPFMDSFTAAQRADIAHIFKPVAVSFDAARGAYKVDATLHYGGVLMSASIAVLPDGKIAFENQHLLLSGIHFPDSPYGAGRSEG
ncbi:MAG: hypothetical protein KGL10_02985 [Alphaproteobacteria bacterium]|nr:hypothetical protein [Alphaproteobacteria bacterium]